MVRMVARRVRGSQPSPDRSQHPKNLRRRFMRRAIYFASISERTRSDSRVQPAKFSRPTLSSRLTCELYRFEHPGRACSQIRLAGVHRSPRPRIPALCRKLVRARTVRVLASSTAFCQALPHFHRDFAIHFPAGRSAWNACWSRRRARFSPRRAGRQRRRQGELALSNTRWYHAEKSYSAQYGRRAWPRSGRH